MDQLVPVTVKKIGDQTIQTVNLRDLHKALGVGRDFATWAKDRIEKFGFIEGQDYVVTQDVVSPNLGSGTFSNYVPPNHAIEYHASLEMGKEVAMVENNERGRIVRRYFIKVEKQFKAQSLPDLSDPRALRQALLSYTERVIALENTVAEQTPKVLAFDRLDDATGSMCITDAAKTLKLGPKQLFKTLERMGWIYRRNGSPWKAAQAQIDCGRLEHKIATFETSGGETRTVTSVRMTAKGLKYIAEIITAPDPNIARAC